MAINEQVCLTWGEGVGESAERLVHSRMTVIHNATHRLCTYFASSNFYPLLHPLTPIERHSQIQLLTFIHLTATILIQLPTHSILHCSIWEKEIASIAGDGELWADGMTCHLE